MTNIYEYTVRLNKNVPFTIKSQGLTSCECVIIKDYLDNMCDGDTATILNSEGKLVSLITKQKWAQHWSHSGYSFSR